MIVQGLLASYSVPSVTYATWNPSDKNANVTLSGGNLTASATVADNYPARSTIGKSSGKWYWEVTVISAPLNIFIGVGNSTMSLADGFYIGRDINGWGYSKAAFKYNNFSATAYGATYTNGDIIGVALDMDGGTITMYKNNVSQGVMFSSLTGTLFAAIAVAGTGSITANFGATAMTYSAPGGFNQGLYI